MAGSFFAVCEQPRMQRRAFAASLLAVVGTYRPAAAQASEVVPPRRFDAAELLVQ
jgi:hypothetical protein